jgi:hypothetical protein
MPESRFRIGDIVGFKFGIHDVQGEIKEDRGPIGIKGRNLYLIEFLMSPQSESSSLIELPADRLELVKKPISTG